MYRRGGEQIEEIIDGAIMEWDLKEFGWESPDFYPKEDEHLELDSDDLHHNHDDLVLDFTNSIRQKINNIATADQSPDSLRLTGGSTSNMADQYLAKAAGESTAKRNDVARGSVLVSPKRLTGTQKMSCLVDGCKADLSSCRDYHRRHRVCERHSKSPIVTVKGEEKRFCQQCSRFHSLGEFDEVKRSCRKRLDGHNRRRRKSHPEPLYWSSKNFLSGYKGPRILNFGNPQIYATATVRGMWPVEPKTCSESWIYSPHRPFQVINYHQNHRSTTPFNGEDKSPFFLQKNDTKLGGKQTHPPDEFLRHPLAPPGKRRDKGDNHNHKHKHMITSSDEETSLPIDSGGRALYLLSTHPTHLISSSCSNNNNNHHLVQPIESCSFQLLGNISHSKNKPVDSPPIYDAAATKQTNRLLRLGPEGFVGTWSSPNASDFVGLVGS